MGSSSLAWKRSNWCRVVNPDLILNRPRKLGDLTCGLKNGVNIQKIGSKHANLQKVNLSEMGQLDAVFILIARTAKNNYVESL